MNVILLRKLRMSLMLLPMLLLSAVMAMGQSASTYSFASSIGTYTQINNATATELTAVEDDDVISAAQNIGFNFVYEGVTYTQFKMSSNGFISFGSASSSLNGNNFSTANASSRPIIAPLWDDLDGSATGGSYAGYELTGTSPNQVLTVEWRNWEWRYNSSNPVMSFQVKLYEATNVIEFVYRQESGSVTSGSASIGIGSATGSGSGSYLNVTDVVTPAVSSTSSVTNINTKPANNQVFTFTPPPACSGQPAVAQTTATITNACANTAFTLGVSGLPVETGYTYEFESSPAGANTWTSLGAAQTSPTFSIASQTAATDYRVVVTCSNSGLSTAATLVSVGQNSFSACYCTPVSNCTNEGIVNVTFDALNNSSVYCGTSGYADYTGLGALATVTQAQVMPITVSARVNDVGGNNAGVWIDYDHSGTFDASEYTSLGSTGPITTTPDTFAFTGNINIPASALTGVTRMRVREANASGITATSACNTGTVYGEYEDYLITINAGTACSAQPAGGNLTASLANISCTGTPFTLSAVGYSSGITGLTFQWQESSDNINFTDIGPDTVNYYDYAVSSIAQSMYYRLVVTCVAGSTSGYSDTAAVTFAMPAAPYSYDVESQNANTNSVMNSCWTSSPTNTTSAYAWHVSGTGTTPSSGTGPTSAHSGNKFFFTEASNGGTNAVAELISPQIDISALTSPELDFWYYMYGSAINKLVISAWNGTAWQPMDSIIGQQQTSQGAAWLKRSIYLTGFTGSTQVKFTATRGSSFEGDISIDDIAIIQAPTCPAPSALTATGITATSANLGWIENGSATTWQIEYGPQGFTQGTGTIVAASSNPQAISGLTDATDYDFYVRSICSPGDTSAWSAPAFSFTTPCLPIATLPWIETFETSSATRDCWKIVNANGDGDAWTFSSSSTYSHNGSYSAQLYTDFNAGANDDWLITPGITLSGNQRLIYWYRARSSSEPNDYMVKLSTTGNDTADFTTVLKPLTSVSNTTYQSDTINLSAYTGTVYLAFHVPPGGLDGYYLNFDDVTVEDIPAACNGTPTPGTAFAPAAVCSSTAFTLTDTAYTFGPGITYQWQESPAGTGAWNDISGATSPTYTVTTGITSAMDYQLVVTCSNGGASDISNTITVNINPFYNCYCTPVSNCTNEGIDSVSFDALSNTSAYCATSGYTDYGSMGSQATVTQAQVVPMAVKAHINSNPASVGVWIDYDHNGTFDAGEYTSLGSSSGVSPLPAEYIFSGNIVIPNTAQTGITRMRVRSANQGGITATSACNTGTVYGEYEDYLVTINAGAACSGSVTAGSIAGPTSVCSGKDFTLTATGFTAGTLGLTYEWQIYDAGTGLWSPAGGTNNGTSYTAIGGITMPTDYRFVVTCINGGSSDATGTYSVALNSPTQCYCIPAGTNSSHYIEDFSTTGGVQNISNLSSGFSSGGYGDFTATDTVSVPANTTFTINSAFAGSNYGVKIWIDFDGDGDFTQTGDEVYASSAYLYSIAQPITIPASATPITTRMRIGISYTPNSGPSGPCMTNLNGEYEDYTITILPIPACLPPTNAFVTAPTATTADLAWTENGTATQWSIEYGPAGFTPGSGTYVSAPTNPFTLTGLTAGTAYDAYVKSICSATDSSSANGPVNINTAQIPVSGYPYTANWDNGGTGNWTLSNGSETNKWFAGTPGDNPAYALGATPGGLYISSDNGVTNGYNNGASSVVHAYRDLDLSSFSSAVPLTFNSYVVGEASLPSAWDFLSVWMVPISYEPVPGTDISTVSGAVPIDTIVLETGWTQHLLNIPASVTGSTARLVLQWQNDGSSGSAPVKVDNLTIGGFPLVIKLRDVSATNLGAKNRVDWSTESELKSDKFELERSADGRNFTYLATIKAKGEASNYSYMDLSPVTGVNYYRLKMIDAAGAVATSKVVTATVKQGVFTVEAYPNPVSEKLTVQVYGGSDQNATVAITDVTGKVMKVVNVVNGKAEVNMNGLASGVYLVKYTDSNHSQTIKVNKQ